MTLAAPAGFEFVAGQYIRFVHEIAEREYSVASRPGEPDLKLCVRDTGTGNFSSVLSRAETGTHFDFTGPHGYFTFRPSGRPAIFVATGTGIAPFSAMARSGIKGFTLLHGVRSARELYYESLFRASAATYVPCLSDDDARSARNAFVGRVTAYLEQVLAPGAYDFYLCGRREMIREATLVADARFPGSLVYSESFY